MSTENVATERRCVRCRILASDAAEQGEPICSDRGMVAAHSYRDLPEIGPSPADLLGAVKALEAATESLSWIAVGENEYAMRDEAKDCLKRINGLLAGDSARVFELPTVRPAYNRAGDRTDTLDSLTESARALAHYDRDAADLQFDAALGEGRR